MAVLRHTLSCCIIVKNEEHQITKCLDNIAILADEIVIVDTGSTDSTCKAINWWIKKRKAEKNVKLIKVGNRFNDEDGDFDFGSAKTFAFQNATKDYVMWVDATDTITDQKKMKRFFLKETAINPNVQFIIPTALSKNFSFKRTRIGPRKSAYMEGRIHEVMRFTADKMKKVLIPIPIENFKKERDLDRNLRLLKKEWARKPTHRICFYLATTYREMRSPEAAIKWFRKRVYTFDFKDEFREEYFKSYESMAEITVEHRYSSYIHFMDLYDIANKMIELEPQRYEGYYYLGVYYIEKKEWKKALTELRKYKQCRPPAEVKLWINGSIYNGKAILRAIEKCKVALKYDGVLKPEEILDYNGPGGKKGKSIYRVGDDQYSLPDTIK